MGKVGTNVEVENLAEITDTMPVDFGITAYDYVALTYVAAGNGAGEIETAVYKTGGSGGTTVGTLTLAYNASNKLISITKS